MLPEQDNIFQFLSQDARQIPTHQDSSSAPALCGIRASYPLAALHSPCRLALYSPNFLGPSLIPYGIFISSGLHLSLGKLLEKKPLTEELHLSACRQDLHVLLANPATKVLKHSHALSSLI